MKFIARIWRWYLGACGYVKKPCPFSGSEPRIRSTVGGGK